MTKLYPDGRPGRGAKADIFKLLDANINQIRDSYYPAELISQLIEAYAYHHCIKSSSVVSFSNEWAQDNNITIEDRR